MSLGSVGGRFADSSVAVTTYEDFEQPEIGEVVFVDVGDGSKLTAGQSVYLKPDNIAAWYYYEVEDAEGGTANQAQLRRVAGVSAAVATGQTMPGGSLFITAPLGPTPPSMGPARLAATTTTGAVTEFSILVQPGGYGAFEFNTIAIHAEAAVSAASGATNYKTAKARIYGQDGTLKTTIGLETTTSAQGVGNKAIGSMSAHATQEIDLGTTYRVEELEALTLALEATNGSQTTPAFRLSFYLK